MKCEIRACGKARDVVNCAYCADFACGKLDGIFKAAPEARTMLEKNRELK